MKSKFEKIAMTELGNRFLYLKKVRANVWSALAIILIMGAFHTTAVAQLFGGPPVYVGPIPNTDFKVGHVMARAVVLDPDTMQPFLVEFNEDGTEAGPIDVGGLPVEEYTIQSAADYRFFKQQLEGYKVQFEETLAKDAELLTKIEFTPGSYPLADNENSVDAPTLPESVNSVFIRGQRNRILPDPDQLVLLSFPFDMTQEIDVTDDDVSLVVNLNGQILAKSTNNIGFRTGFFGDPNDPQNQRSFRVLPDDEVFGPVTDTKVYVNEFVYRAGVDVTDDRGKYSFVFFMPLCPPGGFSFTTDVWAELRYKNLLPLGSPSIPYYLRTPGYSYCSAQIVPAFLAPTIAAIQATTAIPSYQSNLIVDVRFVSGLISIKNVNGEEVEIGETTYTSFDEEAEDITQMFYDFNGDNEPDHVEQGRLYICTDDETSEEIDVFHADSTGGQPSIDGQSCVVKNEDPDGDLSDGDVQGIFFDGSQADPLDFPDLVRIIDQELRKDEKGEVLPIGVLKSISQDDLRNTDVLFFRESTGQLIMERRGLKEAESEFSRNIQYDEEKNEVAYRIMLRGRSDSSLNVGGGVNRTASWEEWATANGLTEPFQTREADQPKPGEFIKVVAINRATGYTGTTRLQLSPAGQSALQVVGIEADPIELRPPNLKIWAERDYTVEKGLTKDEERNYTIGSEGAALTSDKTITIYTEWLDEEGRPLPDELGLADGEEYGLTGRLAKIVGAGNLEGVVAGSDLSEFPIAPGRKTQVLNVPDNLSSAEHFYVHVIGKPIAQEPCPGMFVCADFGDSGTQAPFDTRPKLLTPFLVPLSDEDKHWKEFTAYRKILREQAASEEDIAEEDKPIRPLPAYAWQYRPEYQFSQFELEIQEINRTFTDLGEQQETKDIYPLENPAIASSDDFLTALYSLISSEFERLTPIDGKQELILALGAQEQLITFGEDQSIKFDDIASLAELDAEDFISMRLYTNNDAGNILWEYAFELVHVFNDERPDDVNDYSNELYFISADDPIVDMNAVLVHQSGLPPDEQEPMRGTWSTDDSGNAEFEPQSQISNSGFFKTKITMPTQAFTRALVQFEAIDLDTKAKFQKELVVLPGEPNSASLSLQGTAFVQGQGNLTVTATVRDMHGNNVIDGTTVRFVIDGNASVVNASDFTTDGIATAEIKAGYFSGENNSVRIEVGEIQASTSFTISPLTVSINSIPSITQVNTTENIQINVSSGAGAAENVLVDVFTNMGRIALEDLFTDENGNLSVEWDTGSDSGNAIVYVKTAGDQTIMNSVQIGNPSTFGVVPSASLIVGNLTADQQITYDAPTGPELLDVSATATLNVVNSPNTVLPAKIGSPMQPNRNAKFQIKGEQRELAGILTEVDPAVRRLNRHSTNFGRSLILPAEETNMIASSVPLSIQEPVVSTVFNFQGDSSGVFFEIGNIIVANKVGTDLQLSFTTLSGPQVVTIDDVGTDQWNELGFSVQGTNLSIEINGVQSSETLIDQLLPLSAANIVIGRNQEMLLQEWSLYDDSAPPILLFSDGSETGSVTTNGSGLGQIELQSAGVLNDLMATLDISVGDQTTKLIVEPSAQISKFASRVSRTFSRPINDSEFNSNYRGAAKYNDPSVLNERLLASVADHNASSQKSMLTALSYQLEDVGANRFLVDSVDQLQDYWSTHSEQQALIYSAVDVIGTAIKMARNGDNASLTKLTTGLTVFAELIEQNQAAGDYLASSIVSKKDFQAWLNIFSTPADGWPGIEVPVPDVTNSNCAAITKELFVGKPHAMSLTPCRLTGAKVSVWINELALTDSFFAANPREFVIFLDALYDALPYSEPVFRFNLFRATSDIGNDQLGLLTANIPQAHAGVQALLKPLKWLGKLGTKGMRNYGHFLMGKSNHRIRPVLMLFIMGYLSDRTEPEGECIASEGCKRITDPNMRKAIKSKINTVNRTVASIGKLKGDATKGEQEELICSLGGFSHGAMFELMVIAYYHALDELGIEKNKILGIEVLNEIRLRHNPDRGAPKEYTSYRRFTDIVIKGTAGNRGTFIELKSIQSAKARDVEEKKGTHASRQEKFLKKFPVWRVNKRSRTTYHRQFFLDNVASTDVQIPDFGPQRFADDFQWWFHEWPARWTKNKTRKGKTIRGIDTGVSPSKNPRTGTGKKDIEAVQEQLIRAVEGRFERTVARETLKDALPNGEWFDAAGKKYQVPFLLRTQKIRPFNFRELLKEEAIAAGKDPLKLLAIPPEIEQLLFEFENEAQLAQDIIDGLDEIDFLNIPVDNWYDRLADKIGDVSIPFTSCDP